MKLFTLTLKAFQFEELSEQAKKKAIEDNRNFNVDGYSWHEFLYEHWTDELAKNGFLKAKVYHSGFWSQGDGASFDAEIDLDFFLKQKKYRRLKRVQDYLYTAIKTNQYATHYCHEKTRYAVIYLEGACGPSANDPAINELINQLEADVEQSRLDFSKRIYKDLEETYDSLTGDEAVSESLIANEEDFLEDGSLLAGHRINYQDLQPIAA